jgi:hypothetical protein
MEKLKMYYFNPNTYGTEYITMAKSPEEALENLKKYLQHETEFEDLETEWYKGEYDKWKNSTLENLPDKYSLEEFYEDDVIETEIS